jgi:hypothetical protein
MHDRRSNASRWRRHAAVLAVLALPACAGAYGKVKEMTSDSIRGDSLRVLVVLAGESETADRQMAGRVRAQLDSAGVTTLRRPGTWTSEETALMDICPQGQTTEIDGVLFVWWNQLELRDCATHRRAYHIEGGYRGIDYMVKRLMGYLNVRPPK